jgi:Xaa-Pro dipeptidase
MMDDLAERRARFQAGLGDLADLAFFPVSADMQYLVGVPRPFPNFGAVMHPGGWLEGLWLPPSGEGVVALTRMSAELGGMASEGHLEPRILGDWEDPREMVGGLLSELGVGDTPVIAIGDETSGETVTALCALRPGCRFVSATAILRAQRRVKSAAEIETMRKAGQLTEAVFEDVLDQLKPGMTELDILSEVDYQIRRHGSLGPSFTSALYCSGPNHPLIQGKPELSMNRPLDPPVSVLFDFGAIYEGYCYDFGRTVSFGPPAPELQEIHRLVMRSQAEGIQALRAGETTAEAADFAARSVIEEAGYGEAFRHRLGHGIGLDVHEPPFLTRGDMTILEAGMLFTVEPSITQFNTYSARVEDVVLVGPDRGEPLTRSHPSLVVIE